MNYGGYDSQLINSYETTPMEINRGTPVGGQGFTSPTYQPGLQQRQQMVGESVTPKAAR